MAKYIINMQKLVLASEERPHLKEHQIIEQRKKNDTKRQVSGF